MLKFRVIFLAIAVCFGALQASAEVRDVRVVGNGAPTRITIWTDTPQDPRAYMVEGASGRFVILPLHGAATEQSGNGMGGVPAWTVSGSELRFSLDRPLMVTRVLTLPPTGTATNHRVIIDLDTVSEARFASVARRDMRQLAKALTALNEAGQRREVAALRPGVGQKKYVIVVDAGHGGKDPGALAVTGKKEKDITLAAALQLKELLEADPRYEVRLTRETDTFIELEDRVTLARNWGANLFISLHADAAGRDSVSGASVYTISARGESRIDKEASKNDWEIPLEDGTAQSITGILKDLVKRETKTHSAEFAELLLPELQQAGPVLRDTHKNAGFYVLLAPDVPAVLLELGFLTNRDDANRLQSRSGRQKSMNAVKRGIDRFFIQQEKLLADRSG
ncbi:MULTISPECIES: N-acetylmuramoyl-L-alanine amidase [unclassified Hyphomonas]|jgi:N-acetylmuramoyl-L-alanine amidase|uniref:N-acetylmuramoyl-L-alanine amidase family protein n=1 Tax=unclassified Hyphomonas TaxID=2630699 RepID=UPI000458CB32|nr:MULTISPECIES: N-acetylmuramoyl-L-alanine amidase [unclassified Hyphomonas]KCZ47564.1 cell wall hydrolase [Hyphomonas sp. CY54-11-8]RAN39490.1 cell wall hydrolase [Hyphomonas sp. GM-8P]